MQKLLFGVLVFVSSVACAQDYKPFTVNLAAGFASPTEKAANNDISKAGFVYSIEPQYRLINNFSVGLRFEQAFVQRPEFVDKVIVFQTKTKSLMSAVVTANYELTTVGKYHPYAGLGVGLYHAEESTQLDTRFGITTSYPLPATNVLGGLARIGVKLGSVNLEGTYNLVSDTQVTINATRLTLAAKNSYFAVKVGFTIGSRISRKKVNAF